MAAAKKTPKKKGGKADPRFGSAEWRKKYTGKKKAAKAKPKRKAKTKVVATI